MAGSGPTVLKVGGSLLDWPGLPGRLSSFLRSFDRGRLVAVVGGGGAADWVRSLDRAHGLGDDRSHALALRSLDLTAHVLADLVPGLTVAEHPDDLAGAWRAGLVPVLAPRRFLEGDDGESADPLPHSWDVTTDAIAARLAVLLDARGLVLLKSAPLPEGADLVGAARLGLVDPAFPEAARALRSVGYVNLRDPAGGVVALAGRAPL